MIKYEIFFLKKNDSNTLFSLNKYSKNENGSLFLVPTIDLNFIDRIGIRKVSDDGVINYAIFEETPSSEGNKKELVFNLNFNSEGHLTESLSKNIVNWGEYGEKSLILIKCSGEYKNSLQINIEYNTIVIKSSKEESLHQEDFKISDLGKPSENLIRPSDVIFSVDSGSYFKGQKLILSSKNSNPIFFVKGENTEITLEPKNLYHEPIILNESCTIKAVVFSIQNEILGNVVQKTFQIVEDNEVANFDPNDVGLGSKRVEYLPSESRKTFSSETDFKEKKYNSYYTPAKIGIFKFNKNWKKKNEVAQRVINNIPGEIIYSDSNTEIYLSKSVIVQDFVNCLDLSKLNVGFYGGGIQNISSYFLETQTNKNTLLEIKRNFFDSGEFPLDFYFRNLWNPTLEYSLKNREWEGQMYQRIGRVNLKTQNLLLFANKNFLKSRENFDTEFFDKGCIDYYNSTIFWGDTFLNDESLGNTLTKSPYLNITEKNGFPKKISSFDYKKDSNFIEHFDNGLESWKNPITSEELWTLAISLPLKYWEMEWSISTPIFKKKIFTDSYFKLALEKKDRFGNTIQNIYKIPLRLTFYNSLIQVFFINPTDGDLSHFYSMDAMERDGYYYSAKGVGRRTRVWSVFQVWCPNINNLSIKSTQTKNCYRENTNWEDKKNSFPKITKLDDNFGLLEHNFVIENNKANDVLEFVHTLVYSEGENYDEFIFREVVTLI